MCCAMQIPAMMANWDNSLRIQYRVLLSMPAVSACVDSNGEGQDTPSGSTGGKKGPGDVAPNLVVDREEEEGAGALKKVESLRDADSITSTSR